MTGPEAQAYYRATPTWCRITYSPRTVRVYLPRSRSGETMGLLRIDTALPPGCNRFTVRPHRRGESVVTIPMRASEAPHVAGDVARAVAPCDAVVLPARPRAHVVRP